MNDQREPSRRKMIFPISTVVFAVLFIFLYIISNLTAISTWLGGVINLLKPIMIGALIAYLCNPVLRFMEKMLRKAGMNKDHHHYVRRMLGIIFTYLFVILLIAVFGLLVVPQLVTSIKELVSNYENLIANAVTYVNQLIKSIVGELPEGGEEYVKSEGIISAIQALISKAGDLGQIVINYISSYGSQLVSSVTDLIMALFISFYLLSSKEKRAAQIHKVTTAFLSEKTNAFIYDTAHLLDDTFGKYFSGVILDALFIGVLGFIVFTILDIPNAIMIAFVVAVTNIIPFFGPFLGAIPSAFIIFIVDPPKVIPFVIAILIMQQIDGNIIAPKILGQSTGVSSLCVITALAIMGGIWGIFGMIVGVPLFAVIIISVKRFSEKRLAQKGLPTELDFYYFEEETDDDKQGNKQSKQTLLKRTTAACSGAVQAVRAKIAAEKRYYQALRDYRRYGKAKGLPAPKRANFKPVKPSEPNEPSAPTEPTVSLRKADQNDPLVADLTQASADTQKGLDDGTV